MIIKCLHHLLPLREGGKEVIISHPNSLLHKEGSHAPVSCDNSQYSVGSACFIPLPNSNWKRLVSSVCLHWHQQHSCRLQTVRLKPRSSFWAMPRALWRKRAFQQQSHQLHVRSVQISLWDHIWPKAICQQTPPSLAKCSTGAQKARRGDGCPPAMGNSSALWSQGVAASCLKEQQKQTWGLQSALRFQKSIFSLLQQQNEFFLVFFFFLPIEIGDINLTCQF